MSHEINRHMLLRTQVKLLCTECGTIKPVTDYFAGNGEAKLNCGHRRDAGLAPEPEE